MFSLHLDPVYILLRGLYEFLRLKTCCFVQHSFVITRQLNIVICATALDIDTLFGNSLVF
jgi:hypothetical protein